MIEVFIPTESLPANQFEANMHVVNTLRSHGIPVVGPVGVVGVERGRLSMETLRVHDDTCLVYRWTGVPLPPHMRAHYFTLEKTLAQAIEKENDL